MNTNLKHALLPAAAASTLFWVSCSEDKEDKDDNNNNNNNANADLLIGEWELTEIDGESYGEYDSLGYAYQIRFVFEADGDFEFCSDYLYQNNPAQNESYCYNGDWEFKSADVLEMNYTDSFNDDYTLELTVDQISQDRIEGDIVVTDITGTSGPYEVVLEKQ